MPDRTDLSAQATRTESPRTDGSSTSDLQARPAPSPTQEKTIVSETHSSDGSYEIIYSDGSGEAGQGGT